MSASTPPPAPPLSTAPTQAFRVDVPLHEILQQDPSPLQAGLEHAIFWASPYAAEVPFENNNRRQAALARSRLYSLTAFYMLYVILVLGLAISTRHPWIAVAFFFVGCVIWTFVEYIFHRAVQHGGFPFEKGMIRRLLQERFGRLRWERPPRPCNGNHVSGELKELLPLLFVAAPISFLLPAYTAPVLLAGSVQGYVAEKWLHYAVRYSSSRFLLFRRLKKYHLYHRGPEGTCLGYGIATRFWDGVFDTGFQDVVGRSRGENL